MIAQHPNHYINSVTKIGCQQSRRIGLVSQYQIELKLNLKKNQQFLTKNILFKDSRKIKKNEGISLVVENREVPKNMAKHRNSSNKLSRPCHQNILHAFIHFSFGL